MSFEANSRDPLLSIPPPQLTHRHNVFATALIYDLFCSVTIKNSDKCAMMGYMIWGKPNPNSQAMVTHIWLRINCHLLLLDQELFCYKLVHRCGSCLSAQGLWLCLGKGCLGSERMS